MDLRRILAASERDEASLVSREKPSKNWLRNRRLVSFLSMMNILLLVCIDSTRECLAFFIHYFSRLVKFNIDLFFSFFFLPHRGDTKMKKYDLKIRLER